MKSWATFCSAASSPGREDRDTDRQKTNTLKNSRWLAETTTGTSQLKWTHVEQPNCNRPSVSTTTTNHRPRDDNDSKDDSNNDTDAADDTRNNDKTRTTKTMPTTTKTATKTKSTKKKAKQQNKHPYLQHSPLPNNLQEPKALEHFVFEHFVRSKRISQLASSERSMLRLTVRVPEASAQVLLKLGSNTGVGGAYSTRACKTRDKFEKHVSEKEKESVHVRCCDEAFRTTARRKHVANGSKVGRSHAIIRCSWNRLHCKKLRMSLSLTSSTVATATSLVDPLLHVCLVSSSQVFITKPQSTGCSGDGDIAVAAHNHWSHMRVSL